LLRNYPTAPHLCKPHIHVGGRRAFILRLSAVIRPAAERLIPTWRGSRAMFRHSFNGSALNSSLLCACASLFSDKPRIPFLSRLWLTSQRRIFNMITQ